MINTSLKLRVFKYLSMLVWNAHSALKSIKSITVLNRLVLLSLWLQIVHSHICTYVYDKLNEKNDADMVFAKLVKYLWYVWPIFFFNVVHTSISFILNFLHLRTLYIFDDSSFEIIWTSLSPCLFRQSSSLKSFEMTVYFSFVYIIQITIQYFHIWHGCYNWTRKKIRNLKNLHYHLLFIQCCEFYLVRISYASCTHISICFRHYRVLLVVPFT